MIRKYLSEEIIKMDGTNYFSNQEGGKMPMENMVHMFGGTKKKSTLVDERVIL